jgi:membrane peptidoglycan carboxypeptidase
MLAPRSRRQLFAREGPVRAKQRGPRAPALAKKERSTGRRALAAERPVMPEARMASRMDAPHFLDFVKAELFRRYGDKLKTDGLQIYTTLDVDLQQAGQNAVTGGLARLEKQYRRLAAAAKEAPLQGALIFIEPRTGSVKAFVGGRDYRVSQFNRVTQAHRQPGSLFKPFVFLAAFGRRDPPTPVTPATIFGVPPSPWNGTGGRATSAGCRATTTGSTAGRCRRAGPWSSRSTSPRFEPPSPRSCRTSLPPRARRASIRS